MKTLKYGLYRLLRGALRLFYPKTEVVGRENLPQEPCVVISNHAQMHGPIMSELFLADPKYIWCVGEMMHRKEVPAYAFQDFWSRKPKRLHWFYRLLSHLIAPLAEFVFTTGPSIEVRKDRRIVHTIRETVQRLREGTNVVIFPEHDQPYDNILCEFQDGFVSVAKEFFHQTGREVCFVPMYLAPDLNKLCLGAPIRFRGQAPIKEERRRICEQLMRSVSQMARELPRHRVVPYNNIPKKEYPYNRPEASQ